MERGKILFERLCFEELSRQKERDGIGLLAEKRLHGVLKRWVYDDLGAHELRVFDREGHKSRFVADVLTPAGEIFEIQTASLYPMRKKIDFYMTQTDHPVTVVHPLIAQKHVSWMDPETGEVVRRRKSPLHDTPLSGLALLKPFIPYLGDPRFTLIFPFLVLDEFRLLDGWGRDKRRGSHRYELFPMELRDTLILSKKEDYTALFPTDLPSQFTAKDFGAHTKLRSYALYDVLAVFEGLGALRRCGKQGRAALFERV